MKITLLTRLTVGYIAILFFVILLGVYVAFNLNQLSRLIRGTAADGMTINNLEKLRQAIFSQVSFEKKYFISRDQDFRQKFWEIQTMVTRELAACQGRMDTPQKKQLHSDSTHSYQQYVAAFAQATEQPDTGRKPPDQEYTKKNDILVDRINRNLKNISDTVKLDRDRKITLSSQISGRISGVTIFTAVLTVIVGIFISFFTTRSINNSIVLLQKNTKEIAEGKYVKIRPLKAPPEINALVDDFNSMSAKLQQLDQMKIDFINHVSHELRTPLTAIKEASGMLQEGTYSSSREKQNDLLVIMQEECDRLITSVSRILDLSRMEAKMMEYRFMACSIIPVIQQTVLKLAPIAKRKHIQLELKPLPELQSVRIDAERIGQVLENLIGNALKFTAENGRVVIQTTLLNGAQKSVCVSVADTGAGISEGDLELIFERFARIESGDRPTLGSGLGLAIAKYIVTDHGGKIWAKSATGKGSTFYFALPVA